MSYYKDYGYSTENYSHIHTYLLEPIVKILNEKKDRKILDIGCGNGWLTNHLISLGFDAYGTDASQTGIEIAKNKNANKFFVQDLTTATLPHELQALHFDTIISTEVIEHLYSPGDYLKFCRNILQQSGGGELIVSTPYHGYLKNIMLSLFGKMDKHFTALRDGGHIKFWSKKTLSHVLEENNFTIQKFVGCGRLPYLWKSMIIVSKY